MALDAAELVAIIAGQLLAPKSQLTQTTIDEAVDDAVKIVAAARAATPTPQSPPPRGYTGGSQVNV